MNLRNDDVCKKFSQRRVFCAFFFFFAVGAPLRRETSQFQVTD